MRWNSARHNRFNKQPVPPPTQLEALANPVWGALSGAEAALLTAIERKPADQFVSKGTDEFSSTDDPSPNARIRARLLRWLCTASEVSAIVESKGVRVRGAIIDGPLDLQSASCSFPLRIQGCLIEGMVRLDHAKFPYLEISHTTVAGLKATRLRLEGSLILTGVRVSGELSLQGATIGGNLRLDAAYLSAPGGCAMNLEGANISGAVNLRNDFRSDGHIRLFATQIGKNLECDGTIIAPRASSALLIESAKIGGSILLRNGFRCLGQVRIHDTTLDGSLDAQAARLTARNDAALAVYGTRVKGSIVLRCGEAKYKSRCFGGARIERSSIEGHLILSGARIRAKGRPACNVLDSRVEGRLAAQSVRIDGELILARAIVKNDVIFSAARLCNPGQIALRGRGFHCGGSLLMGERFKAEGSIELFGATIGDEFNSDKATFTCKDGIALYLAETAIHRSASCRDCEFLGKAIWNGAIVGSHLDLSGSRVDGALNLERAQIGGHLVLSRCTMGVGTVLRGDGLRCKGSLVLEKCKARGGAVLYAAAVDGDIIASGALFGEDSELSLNLSRARVGGHALFSAAKFKGPATVALATVGGRLSFAQARMSAQHGGRRVLAALDANGCTVGGEAFFDDGFTSTGAVLLDRARINGNLNLATCVIQNKGAVAVSVLGAAVQGDVDAGWAFSMHSRFSQARLRGTLDLSKASIEGNIDLSGMWILNGGGVALQCERTRVKGSLDLRTEFKTNGAIDLLDASVGSYLDAERGAPSAGPLRIEGLTYSTILPADATDRLRWLEQARRSSSEFASGHFREYRTMSLQPYEQLAQTLKRQGHERDARKIAIAKQVYIGQRENPAKMGTWAHRLYGVTMQFGYRPQRALRFAPVFLIALCTIFFSGADSLMVPVNAEAQIAWKEGRPLPLGYPSFNPIAYTIEMFVPILNFQQKESWRPDDRAQCDPGPRRCGVLLRIYLWIHMVAGWVITTLAVAGFTGLVRKD